MEKYKNILSKFKDQKILVIGDVMLDQFIWGKVSRISPEAPVPIVETLDNTFAPGGAANVAANISSFQGKSILCGVIGQDYFGKKIKLELSKRNIDTSLLISDKTRPTTLKTRIIAHSQQIVRIDREKKSKIDDKIFKKLLKKIEDIISDIQCILFSDYDKGLADEFFTAEIIKMSKKRNIPFIVDPKPQNLLKFKNATIVTPNKTEAYFAVGKISEDSYPIEKVGFEILNLLNTDAVLITQGAEGMTLFEKNKKITHIPSIAHQVYDVTGAGDTVNATLALSLSCKSDILSAVELSNYAASVVVKKIGTATLTQQELLDAIKNKKR